MTYEGQRQARATPRAALGRVLDTGPPVADDPVGVGVDASRTASLARPAAAPGHRAAEPADARALAQRALRHPPGAPRPDEGSPRTLVSGKLNDAFVAGVAGGLRRYHELHGHDDVDELRMAMPINMRTEATANKAGNQFAPARFAVPIGIDDPLVRMNAIRELVAPGAGRARARPDRSRWPTSSTGCRRQATTGLFGSMLRGVDFTTSNVPGAPIPVYLAGARMEAQIAFGPMSRRRPATSRWCRTSDDLNIGINTDPAAVPDPDLFVECLQQGFDEIMALA